MMGDDNATIIGSSMLVAGNLQGDEDLHVLGRVDGSIELDRTLVVAESGIVKAEVKVKNAIVSGVVVGNIYATEAVEITREGRMVGDVHASRVIIVDGASFRGSVDMGDLENMPARPPRSERPKTVTPKQARQESVEEEFEENLQEKPRAPRKAKKKPAFLTPPKSRGLSSKNKKKKKRVVVKRK